MGKNNVIIILTAFTTNTCLQRVFFRFKPVVWWMSINRYHGFYVLTCRRLFPGFSRTRRRKMSAFKLFLQYFATGSDTASCQDYEEYEFVDYLSEETQIDLFTH